MICPHFGQRKWLDCESNVREKSLLLSLTANEVVIWERRIETVIVLNYIDPAQKT
jgi:hypothetical protein